MVPPAILTELRKRTILARLQKIEEAITETRKKMKAGKRYFSAPSYYPLKIGERWVDDRCITVESILTEQDQISMRMIIERLSTEEAALRTELTENQPVEEN